MFMKENYKETSNINTNVENYNISKTDESKYFYNKDIDNKSINKENYSLIKKDIFQKSESVENLKINNNERLIADSKKNKQKFINL